MRQVVEESEEDKDEHSVIQDRVDNGDATDSSNPLHTDPSNTFRVYTDILNEITRLYHTSEGLLQISEPLNISTPAPINKVRVLLVGDPSSGKSSFINCFLHERQQPLLKQGFTQEEEEEEVAAARREITFVTYGSQEDYLAAPATLRYFPYISSLPKDTLSQLTPHLRTHIVSSRLHNFPFFTFIDTPSLSHHPSDDSFDLLNTLIHLSHQTDVILFFIEDVNINTLSQISCANTRRVLEVMLKDTEIKTKIRVITSKSEHPQDPTENKLGVSTSLPELLNGPQGPHIYNRHIPPNTNTHNNVMNEDDKRHDNDDDGGDGEKVLELNSVSACEYLNRQIPLRVQQEIHILDEHCKNIRAVLVNEVRDHQMKIHKNKLWMSREERWRKCASLIPILFLAYCVHAALYLLSSSVYDSDYMRRYVVPALGILSLPVSLFDDIPYRYHVLGALCALFLFLILLSGFSRSRVREIRSEVEMRRRCAWLDQVLAWSKPQTGSIDRLWQAYFSCLKP